MTWDDTTFADELSALLEAGSTAAARRRVRAFIADVEEYARPVDAAIASRVLKALRNHRLFDDLVDAGHAVCQHNAEADVRRLLAHGLIEQGSVTAALESLQALAAELRDCIAREPDDGTANETLARLRHELYETYGSCGRAYKQLYIEADPRPIEPRSHDLNQAIRYYADCYRFDPVANLWHGVNYLALMACAIRRNTADEAITTDLVRRTAEDIIAVIDDRERAARAQPRADGRPALGPWDYATRAEARLALHDNKEAVDDLRVYIAHPDATAFMLGGTLRQFEQLWELKRDKAPGKHMLPVLQARLGELGGRIEVEANLEIDAQQARKLEKIWGDVGYQSIEWLTVALKRTRAVARLGKETVYSGDGTGFLFDGAWIGDAWKDKPLLLTNAHVCSSDESVRQRVPYPMSPDEAMVAFFGVADAAGHPAQARVAKELFTSPPHELDATLLLIDTVPDGIEMPRLAFAPVTERDRVNIIGHPFGGGMTVSLQDNMVVGTDDIYLHYRTPTDPGSSGSPIFNQDWEIVGLHHASAANLDANEGIRIDRLLEAIRARLT